MSFFLYIIICLYHLCAPPPGVLVVLQRFGFLRGAGVVSDVAEC